MATTQEQKKRVLDGLATGLTIVDSCTYAGIGETTFYDLVKRDPKFSEDVQKAKIALKAKALQKITKAGEKSWQAYAWILERKFKQEFGKMEITKEVTQSDIEKMNEDEVDAYLAELEKKTKK